VSATVIGAATQCTAECYCPLSRASAAKLGCFNQLGQNRRKDWQRFDCIANSAEARCDSHRASTRHSRSLSAARSLNPALPCFRDALGGQTVVIVLVTTSSAAKGPETDPPGRKADRACGVSPGRRSRIAGFNRSARLLRKRELAGKDDINVACSTGQPRSPALTSCVQARCHT
jgi:hypothetical protein